LAYHTAWLKVHYTAEFFCANMTIEMDDTDKLKVLYEDAVKFGIEFEAPDINRGTYRFEPVSDKVIRYGLGAIKGTGQQAIEAIVSARNGQGVGPRADTKTPFTSLFDFCARVDRARLNKRTVEALIKAGAFDNMDRNRAALLASVELAFDYANALQANAQQGGLFDMLADGGDSVGASAEEPALIDVLPWGIKERLSQEKTAVGFYLSGHLFDELAQEVRRYAKLPLADVQESRDSIIVAGIINDLRVINGQRGKIVLFKLDDKTATLEASADENLFNANRNLFKDDELLIAQVQAQPDRFSGGLRIKVQQVWDVPTARCRFGKYLRVVVNGTSPDVAAIVRDFPPKREFTEQGELLRGLGVRVQVLRDNASCELQLDDRALFYPSDAALASWMAQAHDRQAAIVYEENRGG
jgi:DNA polymerase III subunit alpha